MIRSNAVRPLHHAAAGALPSLVRDAPLSPGKVAFAWRASVGIAFDRGTAVRLEEGTLIVDAASAQWAREVTRSAGVILGRMQALLGSDAVQRLSVREPSDGARPRRRRRGRE